MALDVEKLKALMKERGVKHKDIGLAAGVTARTVSRWMSGAYVPKDREIRKIAELLGCEPVVFYKNFVDAPEGKLAIHASISAASHNAFEVMGLRYGVTQRDIIEIAPVLFAIVAGCALRVPEQDLDAFRVAKEAGLYVQIRGNAEEATGFNLDEHAARERKCFGIPADPMEAQPRNLFAVAMRRLCQGLEGIVDATSMQYPDAGTPLTAAGFNVDPQFLSLLAQDNPERISDFTTGRLRLPSREALKRFGMQAVVDEVQRQEDARQTKLEKLREASLKKLSDWQASYAADHPETDQEYLALAARFYEPEGHFKQGLSANDRDAAFADPFNTRPVLKEGCTPYYFNPFGDHDPEKKAQAAQVGRLLHLERDRRASRQIFDEGAA